MTTAVEGPKSGPRPGEPGTFIILRPDHAAYETVRRVSRASSRERTAKDFIDFFGNVSVLAHFGPLTQELIDDPEGWRELIPACCKDMKAEREVYAGGRRKQQFMVVLMTDSSTSGELPRWRELTRWIVERFF